jgi:site-specific DNA-methyltransferase (adenine-specific)
MKIYYQNETTTLYHGDCLEILAELPAVDLVLTDPPYNVGIKYGDGTNDSQKTDDFVRWMTPIFRACREKSKTMLISTGNPQLKYYAVIEPWKWLLCWWKPAAMGCSPVGICNWEPIALWGDGSKGGCDVVRAPIIPDQDVKGHPCPKPLLWAKGCIKLFPKHRSVLDPFCGSGTTLLAAQQMEKTAIGIEVEERFCEMTARRLEKDLQQPRMLNIEDGVKVDSADIMF